MSAAWLSWLLLLGADPSGLALSGRVVDSEDMPVVGARVDIDTAAPRFGPAMFCPSCYVDCRKSTTTDSDGRFRFVGLDPSLTFRLLVSEPRHAALLTDKLDPLRSGDDTPTTLQLKPRATAPPERTVELRVVDAQGAPIAAALVEPSGGKVADRRWYGVVRDVAATVTDSDGRCSLALPEGMEFVDVAVTADGFAGAHAEKFTPGSEPAQIVVASGTRIVGRLLDGEHPAWGRTIAVVQAERSVVDNQGRRHHFIGAVQATTDREGRFAFEHLPAAEPYVIFSLVDGQEHQQVLTTKRFSARGDGEMRDLGDLPLSPALRLSGRIVTPAGLQIPPGAKLRLGRDPAWDLLAINVAEDGAFSVGGLPRETYELYLVAPGLELDVTKIPLQPLERAGVGLFLDRSREQLELSVRQAVRQEPGR